MVSKSAQKEIFVTGGAGLIGSFLSEILVKNDCKVFIVDDFSKGQYENLKNIEDDIEVIETDLQNLNQARKSLKNAKNIYHLASRAYGVGYSSKNHVETLLHNEKITNNLLEIFEETKPEKLLLASSSCVYEDHGPQIINERPLFEKDPERVNRGYGWAKRFLEQKFILLSELNKLDLKIVRPFNIYGERYKWVGEFSSAIPMLVKKVMDNEDPIIGWGSGNQRRSYMHAYDCARIMKKIMDIDNKNIITNIGTKETISVSELIDIICEISEKKPKIIFDKTKPEGRFIKSSETKHLLNIIKEELITIDIYEGIKKMILWHEKTFN
tara:strand:+ start:77 stop:1054 length:978 start_codon:yes stop_codon:yes gene_type:complete